MDREHAETAEMLTAGQKSDIEIIIRMYRQQKRHFERNNPRESVKDRIVSISKPYVRPIVLIPGDSRPPIPVILGHPC